MEFVGSAVDGVSCVYVGESQDNCSLDRMTKITDMLQQHQISHLTGS